MPEEATQATPDTPAASAPTPPAASTAIPDYQEPDSLTSPRAETQLTDIFGNFPMVTGVPTWTPKTFAQSIAIDSTKSAIYVYDFTNNQWETVGGGGPAIYPGSVAADGTAVSLPSGWSSAKLGTGEYQVTHNLGLAASAYFINVTLLAIEQTIGAAKNTNTIDVTTTDVGSNTFADNAFDFVIIVPS